MCGIAGSINHPLNLTQLNKDLSHRGPDEQASFNEDGLQLHHYRLSILDIAGGRQPMQFGHLTIIFNGEIYNHQEVRKKYGFICNTKSDTETILQAYLKLGSKCLDEFDGMFAIAIYDRKKNELFLARDRAGKKPLYYYSEGNKFAFASELNALRNQLPLQVDDTAIHQYLHAAYFFQSATPYKNVKELPAGCFAVVNLNELTTIITRWWDIHAFYLLKNKDDFETALNKTDNILHTAVKSRVESSDLEVGSFLSGGIDSGLVTAIASQYNKTLKTFTVSFEGEYNEAPLAKLVADRYGTKHHEIEIKFDHLLDDVEDIVSNYGEPFFDSSSIPSYYVSREAKKHLTVILNGDGGDELFGGYRRYVPFAKYDFFKPGFLVKGLTKMAFPFLPLSHSKQSIYNYLYRLVDFARKGGLDTYMSSTLDVFAGYEHQLLGNKSEILKYTRESFERINNSTLSGAQKMLNMDFDHILASNLLVKMDIATMTHSLEGRSPLLCKDLLEYVPSLKDEYKIKGKQTKYILRKLAEKYLPEELINQPKRGFEIPLKKWVDGELNELIASYLLSPNAYSKNFVQPGFINSLWERKIKTGDEKRAKMIWTLFALEVWHKKCYLGQ